MCSQKGKFNKSTVWKLYISSHTVDLMQQKHERTSNSNDIVGLTTKPRPKYMSSNKFESPFFNKSNISAKVTDYDNDVMQDVCHRYDASISPFYQIRPVSVKGKGDGPDKNPILSNFKISEQMQDEVNIGETVMDVDGQLFPEGFSATNAGFYKDPASSQNSSDYDPHSSSFPKAQISAPQNITAAKNSNDGSNSRKRSSGSLCQDSISINSTEGSTQSGTDSQFCDNAFFQRFSSSQMSSDRTVEGCSQEGGYKQRYIQNPHPFQSTSSQTDAFGTTENHTNMTNESENPSAYFQDSDQQQSSSIHSSSQRYDTHIVPPVNSFNSAQLENTTVYSQNSNTYHKSQNPDSRGVSAEPKICMDYKNFHGKAEHIHNPQNKIQFINEDTPSLNSRQVNPEKGHYIHENLQTENQESLVEDQSRHRSQHEISIRRNSDYVLDSQRRNTYSQNPSYNTPLNQNQGGMDMSQGKYPIGSNHRNSTENRDSMLRNAGFSSSLDADTQNIYMLSEDDESPRDLHSANSFESSPGTSSSSTHNGVVYSNQKQMDSENLKSRTAHTLHAQNTMRSTNNRLYSPTTYAQTPVGDGKTNYENPNDYRIIDPNGIRNQSGAPVFVHTPNFTPNHANHRKPTEILTPDVRSMSIQDRKPFNSDLRGNDRHNTDVYVPDQNVNIPGKCYDFNRQNNYVPTGNFYTHDYTSKNFHYADDPTYENMKFINGQPFSEYPSMHDIQTEDFYTKGFIPHKAYSEYSNSEMNKLRNLWKKERNRLAAKKSRDKKASHIKNLEAQAKGLLKQNDSLVERLRLFDRLASDCLLVVESTLVRGSNSFDSNIARFFDSLANLTKSDNFTKTGLNLAGDSKSLVTKDRLCNLVNAMNSFLSCIMSNSPSSDVPK